MSESVSAGGGHNTSMGSPKNNTPSLFEVSNDFRDLSQLEDFGRESLGLFDINNSNFGRESLAFINNDFGRESLGIINLDQLDIGRESLGITNIKTTDFVLSNVNLPEIYESNETENNAISTLTKSDLKVESDEFMFLNGNLPGIFISKTDESSGSVTSVLNTAFLRPPLSSVSSTVSSLYPSFNSASLESLPSRIGSTSGQLDIMNDAFEDTSEFIKRMLNIRSLLSSVYSPLYKKIELNKAHRRIRSLPSSLIHENKNFEGLEKLICNPKKSEDNLKEANTDLGADDVFTDMLFIEATHLAYRIADGSILEIEGNDMLDSIQEPEDFANISVEAAAKPDTETIFKTVDKMFLPPDKCDSISKDNNNSNIPDRCNSSYCSNNNSIKSTHSNTKSKEAMEIITTLSEILSNDQATEQQKTEGQNLLSSLAEIFLSSSSTKSPSCVLEDSGHSSIESEPAMTSEGGDCYEVLDLRKKSCSEGNISQPEEICVPLDLSMKSKSASEKSFISPKILPPKYSKIRQSSLINLQINHSLASNCSLSSNEGKNLSDPSRNFKPKTVAKLPSAKRGPMKAVLPVDNMARRNNTNLKVTPKGPESKSSKSKLKKTSTPINETNLKPMAQSTPDNPTTCPPSPVARPSTHDSSSKLLKQRLNYSGSNTSLNKSLDGKNKSSSLLRRGSSGDLKKPQNTAKPYTRSHSMGEKSGFTSKIGSGIKQTSQRNSFSHSKTETASVLKENRNKPVVRSLIGKRVGKENAH